MRDWLKEIRENLNTSQLKIAHNIGISQNYYSDIENGNRRPSPEVAQRIAAEMHFDKYGIDWTKFYENAEVG
jgi:transcriptional regulator with XRE-family HTH domain